MRAAARYPAPGRSAVPAGVKKPSANFIERQVRLLKRGIKHKAFGAAAPVNLVCVAADMLIGQALANRTAPSENELQDLVVRYALPVGRSTVSRIFEDGMRRDGWLTEEKIGNLLKMTVAEQEELKLWTFRVAGESLSDQKARTAERQARCRSAGLAERDAKRGPFWINVSKEARELGFSRPTIQKFRNEWEAAATALNGSPAPDFVANFASFVLARVQNNHSRVVGGKVYTVAKLMTLLKCGERTIQRLLKKPEKLEARLAKLKGRGLKAPRPPSSRSSSATRTSRHDVVPQSQPSAPVKEGNSMHTKSERDPELQGLFERPDIAAIIEADRRKQHAELMQLAMAQAPSMAQAKGLDASDPTVIAAQMTEFIQNYQEAAANERMEVGLFVDDMKAHMLPPAEELRRVSAYLAGGSSASN